MYQPECFRVEDVPRMHALMREWPLATLVSAGSLGLYATHIPTVLKEEGALGTIECHLARANPHCQDLADAGEVLLIFQGPEAYITPNWYVSKALHGKVVPTWNYAVVHSYGRAEPMHDAAWLRRHVGELTDQQERVASHDAQMKAWSVGDAPGDYVDAMLRAIVGFRLVISRLEGKWKMSQNRDARDRGGVVKGLRVRRRGDDLETADLIASELELRGEE